MSLTRRQIIAGLGASCSILLVNRSAFAQLNEGLSESLYPGAADCIQTTRTVEGPFFRDTQWERSDISERHPGVPLDLNIKVIDVSDCSAVTNAKVDIWHADALGCYSGFQGQGDERNVSTVGQTFLRGAQMTDSNGKVRFATIYPGWYAGRTPHIHFKISIANKQLGDNQVYFPDHLSEFIFSGISPYNTRRRQRDTFNMTDRVLRISDEQNAYFSVTSAGDRLIAELKIGVERLAKQRAPRKYSQGSRLEPGNAKPTDGKCREPSAPGIDI